MCFCSQKLVQFIGDEVVYVYKFPILIRISLLSVRPLTFGSYCDLKGMLFRWGLFRKVFPTAVPPNYAKKKRVRNGEKKPVAFTGS